MVEAQAVGHQFLHPRGELRAHGGQQCATARHRREMAQVTRTRDLALFSGFLQFPL